MTGHPGVGGLLRLYLGGAMPRLKARKTKRPISQWGAALPLNRSGTTVWKLPFFCRA